MRQPPEGRTEERMVQIERKQVQRPSGSKDLGILGKLQEGSVAGAECLPREEWKRTRSERKWGGVQIHAKEFDLLS